MNRYSVQFGLGAGFLLFSIFASWYEGAEILNHPYEWKYSTPFSGLVLKESDISQLDYFVYAMKFNPTFPIVMILSTIYLLIVTARYFLRNRVRIFASFLSFITLGLLIMGGVLFSSTTSGGQTISYVFLSCGLVSAILALLYHFVHFDQRFVGDKR